MMTVIGFARVLSSILSTLHGSCMSNKCVLEAERLFS